MKDNLPNLLVIGAMKAGTTSFHEMLSQHPDIFMSMEKETNYFIDAVYNSKNLEWYRDQYVGGEKLKIRGESSVSYSKRHAHPEVIENIVRVLGSDIKIIYILRNPINRFVSNFTDGKTYKHIPPDYSINQFVSLYPLKKNPYALTSLYFYQVSPYLERFSLNNILIIEYEELISSPNNVMNEVFKFLNLENWEVNLRHLNNSSIKSYESAKLVRYRKSNFYRKVSNLIPDVLKKSILSSNIYSKFFKESTRSDCNLLDEDSMQLLKDYFRSDLELLRINTGFQAKHWIDFPEEPDKLN